MNRRVDVYRLDSFLSRPSVCLPSATTVQLRLPEVAAVMVLLCWQIKVISGDGDEYGFIPGEIFGRSVTSSFCAIGECPSPASQVFADDDGSLAVDLDDLLAKSLILPRGPSLCVWEGSAVLPRELLFPGRSCRLRNLWWAADSSGRRQRHPLLW